MTLSQYHAYVAAKVVRFNIHSFLQCFIIASAIRLVSLIKMSEEAVMQFFGPDNMAIQKVRFFVLFTSSLISLVLIQDNHYFETLMYPHTKIKEVIITFHTF